MIREPTQGAHPRGVGHGVGAPRHSESYVSHRIYSEEAGRKIVRIIEIQLAIELAIDPQNWIFQLYQLKSVTTKS